MALNDTITSEPLLHIVPSYTALLALIFVYLTFRVIKQRRKAKVAIGDGNNPTLKRAIAVHNNFAQYVPLCLLLIAFLELNHANTYIIHGLCITLLLGRVIHAYGVSQESENFKLRKTGMVMTLMVLIASSLYTFIQVI
jgi:uncharacterized membrane protein YecN with MAPEG domain